MSAPTISNTDMLEIQLRKWIGKGHVHNVKLSPPYSHPSLPAGETVIAEIIDRSSQIIFFTGNGFMLPGLGFIYYEDVARAKWISSEPPEVRAARKREDYDHIELLLRDGSSITLADVEQAVFPLLHFFEWMLGKRKHADQNFMPRLSYEDSCLALQSRQIIGPGEIPPMPQQPPRHDDEDLGVEFYRTMLADSKIERLTLPRTFFGRSEIRATSFHDTDLSESTANWNDFIDVDFSDADISRADFRACVFERVCFVGAVLVDVDFRHCSFTACDFTNANLAGAKLTRQTGASLQLSAEQRRAIDWQASDGEEPEGG